MCWRPDKSEGREDFDFSSDRWRAAREGSDGVDGRDTLPWMEQHRNLEVKCAHNKDRS